MTPLDRDVVYERPIIVKLPPEEDTKMDNNSIGIKQIKDIFLFSTQPSLKSELTDHRNKIRRMNLFHYKILSNFKLNSTNIYAY